MIQEVWTLQTEGTQQLSTPFRVMNGKLQEISKSSPVLKAFLVPVGTGFWLALAAQDP